MKIRFFLTKMYKDSKVFRFFINIIIGLFRLVHNSSVILFTKFFCKKNNLRIVFIGPIHSPHFANFLLKVEKKMVDKNINILQISSDPNYLRKDFDIGKPIIDGSIYSLFGYYLSKELWQKSLFLKAVNRIGNISIKYIFFNVYLFKPDLLWIHDLQSGGYLSVNFLNFFRKNNVTICASVYGNDLYYFEKLPKHIDKLQVLVKNLDFLHVESEREKAIALKFGFNGFFFPVSNVTLTDINNFKNSESNFSRINKDIFLVIKGSYFLRSNLFCFLDQIDKDIVFWKNKKLFVVNATDDDVFHLERIKNKLELDLEYCKVLPHKEFVSLLNRSKYFLTLNFSDGIPNAVVESTYVNCIPIFSNHTGLTNYLDQHILNLIVFEFGNIDFKDFFIKLDVLNDVERIFLIDSLKAICENYLFNDVIQMNILEVVFNHGKRNN